MIDKSSYIAYISRVDHFWVLGLHQVCASRVLVLFEPLLTKIRIDWEHLTYILHDERILRNKFPAKETPSFFLCLNWINKCILVELKPTISAEWTNRAHLRLTFNHHKPVDATLVTLYALLSPFCFLSQPYTGTRGSLSTKHLLALKVLILFNRYKLGKWVGQ
jgi:hypothetical protein